MSVFFFVSIRANRSKHDDFDNLHWTLQLFKGGCISFVAKHRRALAFAIRDRISPGNEESFNNTHANTDYDCDQNLTLSKKISIWNVFVKTRCQYVSVLSILWTCRCIMPGSSGDMTRATGNFE